MELRVREPSLGADADLRVAVSPALAAEAGWSAEADGPVPGLLSGDGIVLPAELDAEAAGRVLDAIAPSAPRDFATAGALAETARLAASLYLTERALHEAVAAAETGAVLHALGFGQASADGDRSGQERFTAAGMGFADWRALHEAPLHLALRWLGARSAHQRLEDEQRRGGGDA